MLGSRKFKAFSTASWKTSVTYTYPQNTMRYTLSKFLVSNQYILESLEGLKEYDKTSQGNLLCYLIRICKIKCKVKNEPFQKGEEVGGAGLFPQIPFKIFA